MRVATTDSSDIDTIADSKVEAQYLGIAVRKSKRKCGSFASQIRDSVHLKHSLSTDILIQWFKFISPV